MKFENRLTEHECRKFQKDFVVKFRVPFDRRNTQTHGPIWNNLIVRSEWINIDDLDENLFDDCYIFHENGRQSALYEGNLKSFITYIRTCSSRDREPLYAVKRDFSLYVSWYAEDGVCEDHYVAISVTKEL